MATLTRPKTTRSESTESTIHLSGVPTPFSTEEIDEIRRNHSASNQSIQLVECNTSSKQQQAQDDWTPSETHSQEEISTDILNDLMPSISYVQKSCIMTLNDLLSSSSHWNPIVPDRRHSMPISPQSTTSQVLRVDSPSAALHTLVLNLRQQQARGEMIQTPDSLTDTELFQELRHRIEVRSRYLEPSDATLANALVSLLSHFNSLAVIYATTRQPGSKTINRASWGDPVPSSSADLLETLKRQLSGLQVERLTSRLDLAPKDASPVLVVETALLWMRIDEDLETVVSLCKERTEILPRFSIENLPPGYDVPSYDGEKPPDYDMNTLHSSEDIKISNSLSQHVRPTDEKMRMDLEAVTMAIDRLYMVAPQLHNQRVELKSSKVAELERASREGNLVESTRSTSRGKQKEGDVKELEDLLDLLGKASERTLKDQAVILEGGMQSRLEKARQRDLQKRDAFVEKLAKHSDSRRIHDQDAMLQPRIKDPEALLSLPEFIREAVPPELIRSDPRALLTLPEFVRELPPPNILPVHEPDSSSTKTKQKNRDRSMSAPPLAWFRPSSRGSSSRPKSRGQTAAFEISYVAENYENLHHILVYFTTSGVAPGVDIQAEVPPSTILPDSEPRNEYFMLKNGASSSGPLILPGYVTAGKKEVQKQQNHFEVKLATIPRTQPSDITGNDSPLLDASQLANSSPTAFICASCSLPLIQSAKIKDYRDLPSEHWEELVEAWMCHSDQKLHEHVVKHGKRGFWPKHDQALVGGSYILFEESAINKHNLCAPEQIKHAQNWTLARCLCGNVVGRCQKLVEVNETGSMMYRMLKYAIRPVSPTAEPVRIPLTAFIVGDMMEYVSAHATYRFIIRDEEEERPRILVWLFKPGMRMSYSASSYRTLEKTASIYAAKVLYKLISPAEASIGLKNILDKYPGFPQAEDLSYPKEICHRLVVTLKETNSVYPEHMRQIAGLDVAWLRRS